jgi:hypothetical protein
MRFLATTAIALFLLSLESVLVKYLGFSVTRIDVTVAIIVFLGLRANTSEGAISSFAIGYLVDVMSGRPTGLYSFLAVLTFVLVRLGGTLVDARSAGMFVLFVAAADIGHGLLLVLFGWITSPSGSAPVWALSGSLVHMFITASAAYLLWPAFRRLDPGTDRPRVGALR